jgi:hypothetical protein
MKIFISFNGEQSGPFEISEVKEKIYRGEIIESQTIAIKENGEHWIPLQSLIGSDLNAKSDKFKEPITNQEHPVPHKKKTSLKARLALVFMIVGFFSLESSPIGLFFIVASVILGILGLREIRARKQELRGVLSISLSWVLLILLIIAIYPHVFSNQKSAEKTTTQSRESNKVYSGASDNKTDANKSVIQNKKTIKEIYNDCSPLIVSIESYDRCGLLYKTGSGVILGPSKSRFITPDNKNTQGTDIITNFHVIDNSYLVLVKTKSGKLRYAQILAFDRNRDIALIRIHDRFVSNETQLSSSVNIGDSAIAIGNPERLDQSISTGIISHLPNNKSNLVQTTAPISHGSSGGGLFNESGDLIGITTATLESGQNLNFAIWLRGDLLNDIEDARLYEGHVWNDTQSSLLKIPYSFGKYPTQKFINKSSYLSILDPDDYVTGKPSSELKTEEDLEKYVENNATDPSYAKYFIGKRQILNEVNKYNEISLKILHDDRLDSEKSLKMDNELSAYRDKQLLPAITTFYSAFPYDESIATMYVKYVQDPTIKENLLKSNLERWPSSLGAVDANWLYKYIKLLVDLGKVQKAHDVLSDYALYVLKKSENYASDDDQTNAVIDEFHSMTEINKDFLKQSFTKYIKEFPDSIKGISFTDIKDLYIKGISCG